MTKSFGLALVFVSSVVVTWGATQSQGTDVLQQSGKRVVGYLDDSLLPKRWAIVRDDEHPEAPRTLVPVASPLAAVKHPGAMKPATAHPQQNVVHAGDRLTLLDDSATLHLQLAAVAIENAVEGEQLRVRLVQGGAILSAVVLSPHRVRMLNFAGGFGKAPGAMR
jgi:hypothetical protein